MNNKTKTRIYASILCFFCLPIFSGYVSGQENSLFPEGEHMDSTALLATVNGRDISLEGGEDGKFVLTPLHPPFPKRGKGCCLINDKVV